MLAGVEFSLHYGVRVPAEALSDQPRLQLRQALVRKLRVMVPALFAPTAIVGVAVAILEGGAAGLVFRCAGLFALLIWVCAHTRHAPSADERTEHLVLAVLV